MARPLTCPHCGKDRLFRARCQTIVERLAHLAFYSPFHCQSCSHRFMASRLGRSPSVQFVDRRQHLRIPVRLFLSFSGGRIKGEGTVLDISMGGCMIQSDAPVHVDDIFYLQIALGEHEPPLEVAAMVRSVGSRGIAFKFLRAAQENKRLMAFVQARSGGHEQKA
jgi:PilZ domain-containing protein